MFPVLHSLPYYESHIVGKMIPYSPSITYDQVLIALTYRAFKCHRVPDFINGARKLVWIVENLEFTPYAKDSYVRPDPFDVCAYLVMIAVIETSFGSV